MGVFLRGFSIFVASLHIVGTIFLFCHLPVGSKYSNDFSTSTSAVLVVIIIVYAKLLVAALLLLKGAIEKRPGHFLYWIIYNCILNILLTLSSIYFIFNFLLLQENEKHKYLGLLILCITSTGISWTTWILVLLCYQELKQNSTDSHPSSHYTTDRIPTAI